MKFLFSSIIFLCHFFFSYGQDSLIKFSKPNVLKVNLLKFFTNEMNLTYEKEFEVDKSFLFSITLMYPNYVLDEYPVVFGESPTFFYRGFSFGCGYKRYSYWFDKTVILKSDFRYKEFTSRWLSTGGMSGSDLAENILMSQFKVNSTFSMYFLKNNNPHKIILDQYWGIGLRISHTRTTYIKSCYGGGKICHDFPNHDDWRFKNGWLAYPVLHYVIDFGYSWQVRHH